MCNYTYHHYPSCGHISNWSMTSCQEYTNRLRLAGPAGSVSCTQDNASHDLLFSVEPSMCVQCEREWAANLSDGNYQTQRCTSYRDIEGLGNSGHIIEIDARMVSDSDANDRDSSSAGHSDNGQWICMGAVDGESGDGDSSSAGHSDNGQLICLGAVGDSSDGDASSAGHSDNGQSIYSCAVADSESLHECPRAEKTARLFEFAQMSPTSAEIAARVLDWSVSVSASATNPLGHAQSGYQHAYAEGSDETNSLDGRTACETSSDEGSCGSSSCGSLCASELLRDNITQLRVDRYIQQREKAREAIENDFDKRNIETFGAENIYLADVDDHEVPLESSPLESGNNEADNDTDQSCIDIDIVQQRIEATVRKRIEESNEKQARQEALSKLLDNALLQKDQYDRRERNAKLGIDEDPHLWDTESLAHMWDPNPTHTNDADGDISPCTRTPQRPDTPIPGPQPQIHLYTGTLFAATAEAASRKGLREARPYGRYDGEWEGFMRAFSAEDANQMGLLDPEHVRGCCDERPATFHLFYGLMHAESEAEAGRRWLEDIRRVPGEEGRFYGLLRADDLRHARAMGLTEIQHPWGCCKDGLFTMPDRERHLYTGFMSAVSLEAVAKMGLCDARPVPGECGEYYGGIYSGYVEADNESEAFAMGLMEAEHGCCVKSQAEMGNCVSIPLGHTYYGYMYASSEAEVVNRGLKDALLVPGFGIKYSGYLQAGSEEEAKAMGLFEPSRIDLSGDTRLPAGFL